MHHIPHTQEALKDCTKLLKSGAPILLYLYYNFENKPFWFRQIWKVSDYFRGVNIEQTVKEQGFLNIEETLKIVSRMGVNRLLVEGGARVWTSFIKTGFFDEIVMFTGNSIINDSSISCFNDFLPLDTRLGDFPNLTLVSLLKWKDNIEARWKTNS